MGGGGGWPMRFYCQHWDCFDSRFSILDSIPRSHVPGPRSQVPGPRSQVPVPVAWQYSFFLGIFITISLNIRVFKNPCNFHFYVRFFDNKIYSKFIIPILSKYSLWMGSSPKSELHTLTIHSSLSNTLMIDTLSLFVHLFILSGWMGKKGIIL